MVAELNHYLRLVLLGWRWIVGTLVVSVVVGALWTFRQPKVFEASCAVVIDPSAPQVLSGIKDVVELGTGTYWANKEFYETQYRVIRSNDVVGRAVDRLAGTLNGPDQRAKLLQRISRSLTVTPIKDSRIATITVRDKDPKSAADFANAIADSYMDFNLELKLDGSKSASIWLGDQVVKLRQSLESSEKELYEYRAKNNLLDIDLDARQGMTNQNLSALNDRLADARTRRIELESERKIINQSMATIDAQEALPDIRQNAVVQDIKRAFIELRKTLAELQSKYGEQHPRVTSVNEQLQTLETEYRGEMKQVLESKEKAYLSVVETEHALNRYMEAEKKSAIELAKMELPYRQLLRDTETNRKLFDLVTQREKETGLTGMIRTNNVRILERAVSNPIPVRPRVVWNLLVFAASGALVGFVIAFVVDSLDRSLKDQEQTEETLGVPVLGIVPLVGEGRGQLTREVDLGVHLNPRSSAAESCRSIRTNLLFLSPETKLRCLVVTSPGPQEGKTTTAISLAITMAQSGSSVVLVDTDMRRPRVHKSFQLPNNKGISSVIVGEARLEEALQSTEVPNLTILSCGPIPPNPAELLHSSVFKGLLSALKQQFEFVIFDSPPTSAVTDPAIIGNLTDGVLLVVRANHTRKDAALFARRQLVDAKAKILGAIVNRVDLQRGSYSKYSYYYRTYSSYQA